MDSLSKCEEEVFLIILKLNGANITKITPAVNEKYEHDWKIQTVSTFIRRLIQKGYLNADRRGRYSYYKSKVSLEDYRNQRVKELQKNLFDDDKELLEVYWSRQ